MTPQARDLRLADHARSGRAAPHARRNSPARASRISRSRRRRTGSTSTGSTACASRPAASPISAAIISTIIRASRPISPPSCRLFESLVADGGAAVIDVDHEHSRRGGRGGEAARPEAPHRRPQRRRHPARRHRDRRLRPDADASSTPASAIKCGCRWSARFRSRTRWSRPGLAIATGGDAGSRCSRRSTSLKGAKGRLDLVGERNGAPIFVDYAHKPDALAKALEALRPYVKRKLVVVFGAGGDRDKGKRPLMGAIAAEKRRPRHRHRRQSAQRKSGRDPRRDPRRRARRANVREIGDRREAIRSAVAALAARRRAADRRQGPRNRPDRRRPDAAVQRPRGGRGGAAGEGGMSAPAVDRRGDGGGDGRASAQGALPPSVPGLSIDTRTIAPGEAFFAHQGRRPRRPRIRRGGAEGRRRARGRRRGQARRVCRRMRRCWSCRDVLEALIALARAARARSHGQGHRRHRLGRQDRHQGGAAARAVERRRDPCLGRLLQQPLGRAAVAGALPGERALRRARNGHEPRRRDRAADQAGAPACRDHHHGRAGASRILPLGRGHRRRQGGDLSGHRAGRRRGHQSRQSAIRALAEAAPRRRTSAASSRSASTPRPTRGCSSSRCSRIRSTVQARILGADVTYKLGAPGRHVVLNSLAVLAAASLAGADLALAALALAELKPPTAAAASGIALDLPGGEALLIDESYNANPASMRGGAGAARPGAGRAARPAHRGARRHAGTRAARRGAASRPGRIRRGQFGRSRVLRRPADRELLGGPSLRAPGRLCRDSRGARSRGARRDARGRCGHGQGLARLEDGPDRQGADPPVLCRKARREAVSAQG